MGEKWHFLKEIHNYITLSLSESKLKMYEFSSWPYERLERTSAWKFWI